jgi:hypothetical protein
MASKALMIEVLMRNIFTRFGPLAGILVISAMMAVSPARADKIKHPIAVFSGLDKITGRTIAFQAATGETVQFGTLQITERACYTRPATEAPQTITFVEVDEIDADKKYKRIFSGWMFAASPGLHGIEHPIYDIWLTDCKGGAAEPEASADTGAEAVLPPPDQADTPQAPEQEASPPPRGRSKKKRTPAAKAPIDEPPQEQQFAEPPPMDAPIEVGRPPGSIPDPQRNR